MKKESLIEKLKKAKTAKEAKELIAKAPSWQITLLFQHITKPGTLTQLHKSIAEKKRKKARKTKKS